MGRSRRCSPRGKRDSPRPSPARGTLDADDLEAAVRAAFEKYLQFDGTPHKKSPFRLHFSDRWAPLLTKLLPVEVVRTDELTVGRSAVAGENGMVRASNALRAQLRSNEREAEDHDYIERCFGRSLYSPQALARIEQRCCTGDHLGCHLWFTRGERVPGQPMRTDTQRLFEQAAEQAKRNRAAYVRDSALHQNALLRLTEQIRNCMLIHQQPEDILAREGRLDGTRVWRTPVLHDSRVFLRKDEESRAGFTVDLMLDASASRLHCQESIAIQGYLLAKSLVSCGIPVRVTSFCSLRGYTVLRVLKDFGDKNGEYRVFDYFAAGWNRDGLALRGMGELMKSAPADKHLLILLTDASPNDSHKILPSGKIPLSRDYDGSPASTTPPPRSAPCARRASASPRCSWARTPAFRRRTPSMAATSRASGASTSLPPRRAASFRTRSGSCPAKQQGRVQKNAPFGFMDTSLLSSIPSDRRAARPARAGERMAR